MTVSLDHSLLSEAATRQSLAVDFERLGLAAEMKVIVHASLSALGHVQGGAPTVVKALMDVLTPKGCLMMPTFNHGAPFATGGAGVYDPTRTPSCSGAVSDAFWRMPGVHRSLNPTHPFAAWGDDAEQIVSGHERTLTLGPDSPLGRLARRGGYLLHLGTSHATSTIKHVAETLHGAGCLGFRRDRFQVLLPGGRLALHTTWRYRSEECPLTDDGVLIDRELDARGAQRRGFVGHGEGVLAPLQDCLEATLAVLTQGSSTAPPCRKCSIGPSDRREGDWD